MSQRTTGLRRILSGAGPYDLLQGLLGAHRARLQIAHDYLLVPPGSRVLDIGCGTAEILAYLPAVEYVGFDASAQYIAAARSRWGQRGRFEQALVQADTGRHFGLFDLVMALGVLHHLDDSAASSLFRSARSVLKPGGRLVTMDPCLRDGQSAIARFLIGQDRGLHPRSEAGYLALAEPVFGTTVSSIREDLLRFPYTHCFLTCRA